MVARRFWGVANDCLVLGNKTYMFISAMVGIFMRVCVDLLKVSSDFNFKQTHYAWKRTESMQPREKQDSVAYQSHLRCVFL